MIYGFMFLASLLTVMMAYEMALNTQSFWSTFFTVASIACWALSALAIQEKIKDANIKIEDLQKKLEDFENGNVNK